MLSGSRCVPRRRASDGDASRDARYAKNNGLYVAYQLVGDGVRGIAVHIGARVSALASAGEVLVSSTVREDRGSRDLKGVPDPWRVLALIDG